MGENGMNNERTTTHTGYTMCGAVNHCGLSVSFLATKSHQHVGPAQCATRRHMAQHHSRENVCRNRAMHFRCCSKVGFFSRASHFSHRQIYLLLIRYFRARWFRWTAQFDVDVDVEEAAVATQCVCRCAARVCIFEHGWKENVCGLIAEKPVSPVNSGVGRTELVGRFKVNTHWLSLPMLTTPHTTLFVLLSQQRSRNAFGRSAHEIVWWQITAATTTQRLDRVMWPPVGHFACNWVGGDQSRQAT